MPALEIVRASRAGKSPRAAASWSGTRTNAGRGRLAGSGEGGSFEVGFEESFDFGVWGLGNERLSGGGTGPEEDFDGFGGAVSDGELEGGGAVVGDVVDVGSLEDEEMKVPDASACGGVEQGCATAGVDGIGVGSAGEEEGGNVLEAAADGPVEGGAAVGVANGIERFGCGVEGIDEGAGVVGSERAAGGGDEGWIGWGRLGRSCAGEGGGGKEGDGWGGEARDHRIRKIVESVAGDGCAGILFGLAAG